MASGYITYYDKQKGWGFLEYSDKIAKSLFFHRNNCINDYHARKGDKVKFEVGEFKGRKCAILVQPYGDDDNE